MSDEETMLVLDEYQGCLLAAQQGDHSLETILESRRAWRASDSLVFLSGTQAVLVVWDFTDSLGETRIYGSGLTHEAALQDLARWLPPWMWELKTPGAIRRKWQEDGSRTHYVPRSGPGPNSTCRQEDLEGGHFLRVVLPEPGALRPHAQASVYGPSVTGLEVAVIHSRHPVYYPHAPEPEDTEGFMVLAREWAQGVMSSGDHTA